MELDHDFCYSVIKSKDRRFDGKFFTAVLTTGIYCRSICPAPLPRPENVRFYPTAAAAREAGFRPCLRCRPESSPGAPDWHGHSELVSRGLRLIAEGYLDRAGVNEMAERLHLGPRQLSRLFAEHLGASPTALAQTRRLHFAKKLIDETALHMSEIAFSAGFSSIRRFNAVLRKTYGKSPTDLRKAGKKEHGGQAEPFLALKLAYRPPFDWDSLIGFLEARAIPGIESVEAGVYRRVVQVGKRVGLIEVSPVEGQSYLQLRISSSLTENLNATVERVRRIFDLNADPNEITGQLSHDPLLAGAIQEYPGLRIPGAWDGFEVAVRAVLGQQISVKAATTFSGRLVAAYGEPIPSPNGNGLSHLFPSPGRLAGSDLTGLGLTRKRAETIRALARAVRDGELAFSSFLPLDETVARLTALPGIGPWTAHYVAMRALSEPDAFPSGDLALLRAAANGQKAITESQLLERAEAWRPWRAYAAMYLWKKYTSLPRSPDEKSKH